MGYADVDAMLKNLPGLQFAEWQAFYRLNPFGPERADLRIGILASLIANVYRKKGAPAFTPADFMPKFDTTEDQQSSEQMKEQLMKLAQRWK